MKHRNSDITCTHFFPYEYEHDVLVEPLNIGGYPSVTTGMEK